MSKTQQQLLPITTLADDALPGAEDGKNYAGKTHGFTKCQNEVISALADPGLKTFSAVAKRVGCSTEAVRQLRMNPYAMREVEIRRTRLLMEREGLTKMLKRGHREAYILLYETIQRQKASGEIDIKELVFAAKAFTDATKAATEGQWDQAEQPQTDEEQTNQTRELLTQLFDVVINQGADAQVVIDHYLMTGQVYQPGGDISDDDAPVIIEAEVISVDVNQGTEEEKCD